MSIPATMTPSGQLVVPALSERQLPPKANMTEATNPWPLALLATNTRDYLAKIPQTWVEAQVVSIRHRGTTVYIDIKDLEQDYSFSISLFGRAAATLPQNIQPGSRIVAAVKPSLWKNGSLMLNTQQIYAVGTGNLHEQLQQLREKLQAEGLFNPALRKPLPYLPHRVGLITGRNSDAEKDVIRNASARWPQVAFEVRTVKVQGADSPREVIAALRELDAHPEVDVIVIARGGGSFEDLLGFSDEALIRAVAAAQTPVVSAIGHEADQPLLDLVADFRASTPTDAGKNIVPDLSEEMAVIQDSRMRMKAAVTRFLDMQHQGLQAIRSRPSMSQPETDLNWRTDELYRLRERASRAVEQRIRRESDAIGHTLARVRALSPLQILSRGYSIVQRADGSLVRDTSLLTSGEPLVIHAEQGTADVRVV
ncbi:MAG: exodeoxyribonuclease VII large subunit [Rothia sp. (in: high G+C Gram-positive bacteria)]|uniref:exodeoxyribonuclease VII large subunit n=1 Tax=Rothia sp. (in: high G+C Gram-positive bacteria) TaxID=1885016 RepID=UPI0026E099E6|nr:exodeoxyribonuclease VII large subunit [Rothia sp. (in: high G+C Gram-positive bacteria)]MDO5750047.1 exodeoxyribonuclease VII large subunit [Rothia sp. (in: high G+C Gram-positive bacteria)]